MKQSMKKLTACCLAAALATAAIWLALSPIAGRTVDETTGMTIPEEAMFSGAPSAETDGIFDISFTYDDAKPPVTAQGRMWQPIRWTLRVFPKKGITADGVSCTLILNDWILERSSSPSLKYMGMAKGYAGDMPEDSEGIESVMEKSVASETLNEPGYEEAMTAPVKIMLAYDGQEKYYTVTPVKAAD